jgi:maltose/moltooligosaccharide transporter
MKSQNQEEKLNYGKTFLIGFGFFASSLLWSIYNSFVPLVLADFLESTALIGTIMTIDNFFGVIFQPLFGSLSDRTHTPIGKRMPYILIGAPLCGLLFALIPKMPTLLLLMAVVILFNFLMSVWRSPMIALMPDLTPHKLRSKANGIINLMGGLASIIAFLIGGKIANAYGRGATFLMGSVVMIIAVIILVLFVKEHKTASAEVNEERKREGTLSSFKRLPADVRRSLLALLLAIFFWFSAFNAVETFFTSFATSELGLSEGSAAMLLAFFSVSFVLFAVPAGIIGGKIGRKKTILIGLFGMVAMFTPLFFINNLTIFRVILLIGGFFWAMININSLPMVLEMATDQEIGTFTGYYYFFSFSAAIVSPILFGFIRDITENYNMLFIYAPVFFLLALISIIFVRHGEATH